MNIKILTALFFMLSVLAMPVQAQEAKVVLRSTVTGNQEQPKVLYLVPWQKAETPELIYQPLQSLVDGVFNEVGREEFLREIRYRDKIKAAQLNP
jgi:hypothetical protein